MDDLTQCLYEFLMERRMGCLREDAEYKACISDVELQEDRVKSFLNKEQRKILDQLLDRISEQDSIARAYMFQATLNLLKELNALVRA